MQSLAQKQALMADVVNFASSKLDTNLQVAG
jgi:LPPG:FO 2-phospho-L-lactate transferase